VIRAIFGVSLVVTPTGVLSEWRRLPPTIPRERETEPDHPDPEDEMQEVVGSVLGHEVGRRLLADDVPVHEQQVGVLWPSARLCGLPRVAVVRSDVTVGLLGTLCYRLFVAAVWLATLWGCGYLPRLVSFFNMPVSTATGRCCSPA
jgi:hypothetical protein